MNRVIRSHPHSTFRAIALIAAFLTLLWSLGWTTLTPWLALDDTRNAIADAEMILSNLKKGVESTRSENNGDSLVASDYIVIADTATGASAYLQRRINDAMTAAGGSVLSTEIKAVDPEDPYQRIELIIVFEIDPLGLQLAVHTLEAQTSAVFIEQLSIHVAPIGEIDAPARLQGSTTISAFWRAR